MSRIQLLSDSTWLASQETHSMQSLKRVPLRKIRLLGVHRKTRSLSLLRASRGRDPAVRNKDVGRHWGGIESLTSGNVRKRTSGVVIEVEESMTSMTYDPSSLRIIHFRMQVVFYASCTHQATILRSGCEYTTVLERCLQNLVDCLGGVFNAI